MTASAQLIRIATRSSRLALWQAEHVASLLTSLGNGIEAEIIHVSTLGDRDQKERLAAFGGQGVFTREVQKVVLDDQADIAVHSLKDLPTEPTEGLVLGAVPDRAPRFDSLILPASSDVEVTGATILDVLPPNAKVGTGSPRRRAQLLNQRSDLQLDEVRGNVETRLRKLDEGQFDALILAEAGLRRLELADRISATFAPPILFPAVGQGALGIECRSDDDAVLSALAQLTDSATLAEVTAERSLLRDLRAGCHAPLGVITEVNGDEFRLEAVVLSLDGQQRITASGTAPLSDAENLGIEVADALRSQDASELLNSDE